MVVAVRLQPAADDRVRAEQLARDGRTADAIAIFGRIVAQDPRDDEARIWLARLALRLGQRADAEAGFRAVLARRPGDVDASIGLGNALLRGNDWRGALALLEPLEGRAAGNADLLATLARAYRRAGDDRRAMQYFERAHTLAPSDPDVTAGYEAVARVYGHAVLVEGWTQGGAPDLDGRSGSLAVDLRVMPRLRLRAGARTLRRSNVSDATGGVGLLWRAGRATTLAIAGAAGPDNVGLARRHVSTELLHYAGPFEAGAGVRALDFGSTRVLAVSPTFAWDRDRWRVDTRYTFSRSMFEATDQTSGDHSIFVRGTLRAWRRAALTTVYAYGIESFEDLTADRLSSLGTTTAAAGVQVDLASLTRLALTWEHQWRSTDTSLDRLTLTLVQILR